MSNSLEQHTLPSREFAYNYTAAMTFAQQFELDLRAILWTCDYHGWMNVELTTEQKKRFKDFDGFIDEATCGALLKALREAKLLEHKKAWSLLDKACSHRNKLAHSYLTKHEFTNQSETEREQSVEAIQRIALTVYQALSISRTLRDRIEALSDEQHQKHNLALKDIGFEHFKDDNRKYATRNKK